MENDINVEEWRKIPGLPEHFEVSNHGGFRSLGYIDRRGHRLRPRVFKYVNAEVYLVIDGKYKGFPVGALILRAFVGPAPEGRNLARHLNDDRSNNHLYNLAWGSPRENIADAKRNGRTYISLGHLGKPHSEETKEKIRKMFKGVPTGRKMSESHKAAIWAGYRLKFPEKLPPEPNLCKCGCGKFTIPGNLYIHGHSGGRKKKPDLIFSRMCACGCGKLARPGNFALQGHRFT